MLDLVDVKPSDEENLPTSSAESIKYNPSVKRNGDFARSTREKLFLVSPKILNI